MYSARAQLFAVLFLQMLDAFIRLTNIAAFCFCPTMLGLFSVETSIVLTLHI